jgi:hypothetical protein
MAQCLISSAFIYWAQLKEDEDEGESHYRSMIRNGLCDRNLLTPHRFTSPKKETYTDWIRGWVGPNVGLDAVKTPAGNRASILASQCIRYTEGSRYLGDIRQQKRYKLNSI